MQLKTNTLRRIALSVALPATLLFVAVPSHSQGKSVGRGSAAIKQAEAINGKPLTSAQKKAIRTAQSERQKAIQPIQKRYRTKVAASLGISVAQYEQREKALRKKKKN